MAIAVVESMPISMAPLIFLDIRIAVMTSPADATTTDVVKTPKVTSVASLFTTIPADLRPMKAMKSPIPTPIARFRFMNMVSVTISLNW